MKKLILALSLLLALTVVFLAAGIMLFALHFRYNNDQCFAQSGDQAFLKSLIKGTHTEDWDTFLKETKAKGEAVSIKAEKQRFFMAFTDKNSGDYSPGEIRLELQVRDLRQDKDIYKQKYTEPLPVAVIKTGGESAQEAAYREAERKLLERLDERISALVYSAMLNYPDKKETFMPIMEKRINDPEVSIRYGAGRAYVEYGNDAVPGIVRAAFADPKNDIVCAALIKELKNLQPDAVPELEKLLKHPSKKVQGAGIAVLTRFIATNPDAKQAVLQAIKGSDTYVQQSAITAIDKMGTKAAQVPEIRDVLLTLMLSGAKGTDWKASKALCALGKPAFPTLIKALEHQQLHDRLKYDICRETPEAERSAIFPLLVEAETNGSPTQKKGAEIVLNYWPGTSSKSYYSALEETVNSPNRELRLYVVQLLADKVSPTNKRRRYSSSSQRKVKEILGLFLEDKDAEIRRIAMQAVLSVKRSPYGSKTRSKALMMSLKQAPKEQRLDILKKLTAGDIQPDDLPILVNLVTDQDPKVAEKATDLLCSNRELRSQILPLLVEQLPKTAFRPRERIISTLCMKDNLDNYLPVILKESWDPVAKKQVNVRSMLYHAKLDARHLPTFRKMLAAPPSASVAKTLVALLSNFDRKGASEVPYVTKLMSQGKLKGEESDLFYFLKQHGDAGIEGIVYCLRGSPHTSGQAYRHLPRQDKSKVIPLLSRINKATRDPEIKKDTTALLKKLQ